jgi:hypothetical protein
VNTDREVTKPVCDVEVPPVVHVGSWMSPEDRIERGRREAKWRRRLLIVFFITALASVAALTWMTGK